SLIIWRKGIRFIRNDIKDRYRFSSFSPYWNSDSGVNWPLQLTKRNGTLGTGDFAPIDYSATLKSSKAKTLDIFTWENRSHAYLMGRIFTLCSYHKAMLLKWKSRIFRQHNAAETPPL